MMMMMAAEATAAVAAMMITAEATAAAAAMMMIMAAEATAAVAAMMITAEATAAAAASNPGTMVRLSMALGILAINSYADLKYRRLMGRDHHYAVLGGAGLLLLLFGGWEWADILSMVSGVTLALLLYRCRAMASGDCLIIIVVSAVLPTYGVLFLPVMMTLVGMTLLAACAVSYNIYLNISQAVCGRGWPFSRYDVPAYKKAAAFFMVHQKRRWERYVVPVTDGSSFSLLTVPFDRKWAAEDGQLVVVAAPMVPFLLAAMMMCCALTLA